MKIWQLQEAKAKFSELVRRALSEGPQHVTRHEKDAVVILSEEEYRRLSGRKASRGLTDILLSAPSSGPDKLFVRHGREER